MGPEGHHRKDSRAHFQLSLRQRSFNTIAKGLLFISAYPYQTVPPHLRYVPTQFRANLLCILLLANAAISFASTLLSLLEVMWPGDLFGEGFENNPVMVVLALLTLLLAIAQVLVYVVTVVVFLMWLYRAHENLASFGILSHQLQYSSAWAVGSFFVPIANLIIPYGAIKELWQKSVPNSAGMFSALSPPAFFSLWWLFWIVSNIAHQIYFRLSWREETASDAVEVIGAVGGVLGTIAALLAIKVVREIQRQQVESSTLTPTQPVFSGPPAPPQFGVPGSSAPGPSYTS